MQINLSDGWRALSLPSPAGSGAMSGGSGPPKALGVLKCIIPSWEGRARRAEVGSGSAARTLGVPQTGPKLSRTDGWGMNMGV